MKRFLETGNFAITEGAIMAGCQLFSGYPITPATEIAEAMSRNLPRVGGYYVQAEDECGAMHMAVGAAAGGMKTMTATSGPGFILYADPYGWAIGCEIPIVVLNSQRVGPVSGITGAPGQGEFYNARYPTQGGNYETIVLAPNGAQANNPQGPARQLKTGILLLARFYRFTDGDIVTCQVAGVIPGRTEITTSD